MMEKVFSVKERHEAEREKVVADLGRSRDGRQEVVVHDNRI